MPGRREAGRTRAAALSGIVMRATTACAAGAPPAAHAHAGRATTAPSATAGAGVPRRILAAQYLAVAEAGNRRLEIDFDGLERHDHSDLARAQGDLRDAAATEHLFDRRVLALTFPPAVERIVRALFWLNEVRAQLTTRAAASRTLAQLRGYEGQLTAANQPVEQAVGTIRKDLGLPPPDTS